MEAAIRLSDVREALACRDPELPKLICALAESDEPRATAPVRPGAITYDGVIAELRTHKVRHQMKADERRRLRETRLAAVLGAEAEVPPPDRLRLDEVLLTLWRADEPWARSALLAVIQDVPLRWGPWRGIKHIFKEAEAKGDYEVWGAIVARLDTTCATSFREQEVRKVTLSYLVRRAWRTLRGLSLTLPAAYADASVQVLRAYGDSANWAKLWVASHIFYHETKQYGRRGFRLSPRPSTLLKYRYAPELWRRSPRPLFSLLETAKAEQARRFAADALRADFRAELREVEPAWVARLTVVISDEVHDFVVWLLKNVPRFEQASFRELGLHEPVLSLLESPSSDAATWAAGYARTHARDLSLDRLIKLANNDVEAVRLLARDLLSDRDPRADVGLEGWGRLLGSEHGHNLAAAAIRKHFGARELTTDWFRERLLSGDDTVFEFASDLLVKVHPLNKLGAAFFRDLLDDDRLDQDVADWAMDTLGRFSPDELGIEAIRRLLVHPRTWSEAAGWVDQERVKAIDLGADFIKAVAFEPTWLASAFWSELLASGRKWAKDLSFNSGLSRRALGWLKDVRRFSPSALGFGWLMELIQRGEAHHHEFAVEYMVKAFLPADFAPKDAAPVEATPSAAAPAKIDLGGASFLFTGKLNTMTRDVAEGKVTSAGGSNAAGVSPKLDYLVIGDEGSPLYGMGRKGSKQVKAESLMAKGAPIRIISETAFLQMLAGEQRTFDTDTTSAGCEALWDMVLAPGDTPLGRFALRYVRRHHVDLGLEMTDRPVDPGAEIPADWLTFERVKPLFLDPRSQLRELALDLARFEMARWQPPMPDLVQLSEASYAEVRAFVRKALTVDEHPDHKRIRIDPARLTPEAVYRFCESLDAETRALGMELIGRHKHLALPEELFRLSESPDRNVRAFVVRTVRGLYRDRGITEGWKPTPPPVSTLGKAASAAPVAPTGPAPRPASHPASAEQLAAFLRQTLYGVPPARPPKDVDRGPKLRPLPARKAKLALVEVLRDLAVEDANLAAVVAPVLRDFSESRGASERAACFVALTRIRHAHPGLDAQEGSR
ncbi:MAG: BRCT domain-containing protein [Deltaproteobacteria bacterium]|nr:BRCT domain-containing protein [Deltaproteobacteria bacterium]